MYKNTYFVDIAVKASTKFNIYLLTLSRPVISTNGKDDKLWLENVTWHILPPTAAAGAFANNKKVAINLIEHFSVLILADLG